MRHLLTGKSWRWRAVALFLTVCIAAAAFGWGDETHRAVARGAAVILPDEVRPFFLINSDFIARHSTDPDYLPINRTKAQRAEHFLDIDSYGAPPFKDLPHDRAELEKKYGAQVVIERGLLPWTVHREFERLVKAFRDRDWAEARLAAAHLSHYVADTTMPLHATQNYDGQMTGNSGVHRRIELEMVGRYHNVSLVAPSGIAEIGDPVEWTFRELERSLSFCPAFLKADTDARLAAPLDSEAYYLKLNDGAGAIVDERTRDAANAIAGFWLSAWQKAGRPALPPTREIVVLVVQSAPVPAEAATARHLHGLLYPEPELRKIAAASAPFDAMAVAHAGVSYKAPRQSLFFLPALDARDEPPRNWGNEYYGKIGEAIHTVSRSFEQFPSSQRVFIVLCYGWKADAGLPAAVEHLKSTGAKSCVFTIGTFAEIPSVKQFAADSGAAFHDLGESKDAPDLVAKELAPLLAPVDAR
jgi:hypothetical protein